MFDTSSAVFSYVIPDKKLIPDRFQYKEPPAIDIQENMIGFNQQLLEKIKLAFKPAALDFSEKN